MKHLKDKHIYFKQLFENSCIKAYNDMSEGLIKTYPPDYTFTHLKNYLTGNLHIIHDIELISINHTNKIVININQKLTEVQFKDIKKEINLCGYFIATLIINTNFNRVLDFTKIDFNDVTTYEYTIEAKYECNIDITQFSSIFHVSPTIYNDKIQSIGLKPNAKSKKSYHPPRVYFETDEGKIFKLLNTLSTTEQTVFEINTNGLKEYKFYQDPNYITGIYTFDNIRPEYIKIYT